MYEDIITNQTSQLENDIHQIKEHLHLTRQRKEKISDVIQNMRTGLNEVSTNIFQELSFIDVL